MGSKPGGDKKGKGGGGDNLPKDLMSDYARLSSRSEDLAIQNAERQRDLWNLGGAGVTAMQKSLPQYQNLLGSATENVMGLTSDLKQEGYDRSAYERAMLQGYAGNPALVQQMGNMGVNPQLTYARGMANLAPIYGNQDIINQQLAMSRKLSNPSNSPNQAGRLVTVGNQLTSEANLVGNQLTPLRQQTLGTLNDVAQGKISPAIQELFTSAGGTRERDILELQMRNARNNLIENSGAQGGMLERNLAALETQRALGLAEQESRRTDQQRQLAANLFGIATEQGISAPQQEAGLRGQAANAYNLAGQQQIASSGLLNNNFAAAAGLLQSAGQQRQSGLTGAMTAMDAAAARDLSGRQFQQQSYINAQNLAQQLAGQYGTGADALRLAAPQMTGQGLAMAYQGLTSPFLPAQYLSQIPIDSPSNYLSPAMSGYANIMGTKMDAISQQRAAKAQQDAATGQAVGALGSAAIMAMMMT